MILRNKNIVIKVADSFEEPKMLPKEETKVCKVCKRELPLSEFYRYSNTGKPRTKCKACFNSDLHDIKGKEYHIKEEVNTTLDELTEMLYDQDKEFDYTLNDLIEELESNGENAIRSLKNSLIVHNDLLSDRSNRVALRQVIFNLAKKLDSIMEV